ncbi:hypothetical protein N8D56_25015 (plasmid) [Devosia sp. A8/3-2]|nr:hypothetical protein N8D56_25015 [Devosia sp. A8/3-2]
MEVANLQQPEAPNDYQWSLPLTALLYFDPDQRSLALPTVNRGRPACRACGFFVQVG